MVTASDCAVVMLPDAGVMVTTGVVGCVTVNEAVPVALLYIELLAASGVYFTVSVSEPAASEPAAIAMLAEPAVSVAALDV